MAEPWPRIAATDEITRCGGTACSSLGRLGELYAWEVGAVIGAHVGPGLSAVVVAPR